MKPLFYTKTLIALAVAVAAAASAVSQAQEQPIPPPASADALPPNIDPSSPVAQVIKLAQAGVDAGVIRNFIANTPGTFNLDAERVVYLNDLGIPTDLINAMLDHDKNLSAPAAVIAPPPAVSSSEAAPPTVVTVNYFQETLSPYGSWVEVEGYGRCWRPTTVIYDSTWQPYCDRGHWVYSDYGWYWDSDYSWGATFHYGRWFRHARYGWCWWPDTVWAPSWVTWRSSSDYCGWAPLPPFTVYRPGFGFFYRGASVAVGFDFGLDAGCFTFISPSRFCDRRPRYYRADHDRVTRIFNQTTVINNYNEHNRTIVNGGISVDRINVGGRRPLQAVAVSEIPNAGRHGWRGNDSDRPDHRPGAGSPANNGGRNPATGPGQNRPGPVIRNDQNNDARPNRTGPAGAPVIRQPERGQPTQTPDRNRSETSPAHPQTPTQPGNRPGLREDANHSLVPPANNNPNPASGTAGNRGLQRNDAPVNNWQQNRNPQPQTPPAVVTPPVNRDQPRRDGQINSGETARRVTPPVTPPPVERSQPANNWQPSRNPQPASPPAVTSPHSSTPSSPAPPQTAPRNSERSSDRNADKDKQKH